ncbi:hypothetical protein BL253_27785 [Pseudofrankia asymbiotica]|uniref:ABC transporter permease n=2 Tax=Pseudofrankia asymbiotica TaxID=1834516 RepID=A0A1V2I4G6_9ACTN|nr:hypothetical protein BL253_27785 [Pseudofrankia asymbiotica]
MAMLGALVLGLTVVVMAMLAAFSLPAVHGEPRHVPLGVTGPQRALDVTRAGLAGDAWDVEVYGDRAALAAAVKGHEISGGFALGPDGIDVYTASAGGTPVATAISAAGSALAERQRTTADVHDLVAFPSDDPRGAGFGAVTLPMMFAGILPAVMLIRLFPGSANLRLRIAGAFGFALAAGAALTAFLQYGAGSLAGDYWRSAAGLALGMAAVSITALGLDTLLGYAGVMIMMALTIFLGNPLSGLSTGPHWLPDGWSTLGQLLPLGASGSLLRATAFFDGAGAAFPVLVLAGWIVFGLTLVLIAAHRPSRQARRDAGEIENIRDANPGDTWPTEVQRAPV